MNSFSAPINKIGINPFVFVPEEILNFLFTKKKKGPIPIKGTINKKPYQQTLVKYAGQWRLYINTSMIKNSPERIGETINITIDFDTSDRSIQPHPKLAIALEINPKAQKTFKNLAPSLQKEIIKYISMLKTEQSVDKNVEKAIGFLLGKERFIGRNPIK